MRLKWFTLWLGESMQANKGHCMFMNIMSTAVCHARIGPCTGRLHIMLYWTALIQPSLTGAHNIIAAILIRLVK